MSSSLHIPTPVFSLLRYLVRAIDRVQRTIRHIEEFSESPSCVLRIELVRYPKSLAFPDGTRVDPGDIIGELHLWNERIPAIPPSGADPAWAIRFVRLLVSSLKELARVVETEERLRLIKAFRAIMSLQESSRGAGQNGVGHFPAGVDAATRLGFVRRQDICPADIYPRHSSGGLSGRIAATARRYAKRFTDFWENLYAAGLIAAFNPESLRKRNLRYFSREEFWITRDELLKRYGKGAAG